MQIGSVFLVKVDGNIVARNVMQREMAFLEHNSGLLSTPRDVLAAFDRAADAVSTADRVRIEDGAIRIVVQRPDDRGCVGLTVAVGDDEATSYEVGFDTVGLVPVSSSVIHVRAHEGRAVIRARDVTITVRRSQELARQFELAVASGNAAATSYELNFI